MVRIKRINRTTYSFALSDREDLRKVARALTFPNPNPMSRRRELEFYDKRRLTFRLGMITTVRKYLDTIGTEYSVTDWVYPDVRERVEVDKRLTNRFAYQAEAVSAFFRRRIGIVQVPTRGGKTMIAAEAIRVFLETEREGRVLFCVDNTTLFTQAVNDFRTFFEPYGGLDIGEIRSGSLRLDARVTVCMIQTLQRTFTSTSDLTRRRAVNVYLTEVRMLCVDEIHDNCSPARLRLFRRCVNAEYQLSLSATPYRSGALVDNLRLQAWSGDVVYRITEDELRKRGVLSEYKVICLSLEHASVPYPMLDEGAEYPELRRQLIFQSSVRNGGIARVVEVLQRLKLKSLLLFSSVEHGETISRMTGLPFISGGTGAEEREERKRELLENGEGGILLASDIFKKGVTLPSVEVLLICDNNKETALTIQRKGRVLGATEDKKRSIVIDILDVFPSYFSEHSLARLKTYEEAVGEENIVILDMLSGDRADGFVPVLERCLREWFNK